MAQNNNFQAASVTPEVAERLTEVVDSATAGRSEFFGLIPACEQLDEKLHAGDAIADDFMTFLASGEASDMLAAIKDAEATIKFLNDKNLPSAPDRD